MKTSKGLQGKDLAVTIAADTSRRIKPQRVWVMIPQDMKGGGAEGERGRRAICTRSQIKKACRAGTFSGVFAQRSSKMSQELRSKCEQRLGPCEKRSRLGPSIWLRAISSVPGPAGAKPCPCSCYPSGTSIRNRSWRWTPWQRSESKGGGMRLV